jgi:hypothetical protein
MKAKIIIGDSTRYITFPDRLLEAVKNGVDDFQDRTDADWYFIYKDYNVVKVESEEQIEGLYWA